MSSDRNSKTLSPYFILMKDKIVHGHGRTALVNRPEAKDRQVLKGTLLEQVKEGTRPYTSVITGPGGEKLKLRSLDHDSVGVECVHDEVARISRAEKDLLLALVRLRDRYDLYNERTKVENGKQITVDSVVYVVLPTLVHEALGKVRYRGPLPGQQGTHFGVELLQDRGQGTTDGTFRKQRLFHCEQDCGVFVTLQKINLVKSGESNAVTKSKDKDNKLLKTKDDDEIQIGTRVVIFCADDNGSERAEYGVVRYMGLPKKLKGDKYVGIELDNPAGQGTGKFDGKQLFTTKKDHATLVPRGAVLPAKHMQQDEPAKPKNVAPSKTDWVQRVEHSGELVNRGPNGENRREPQHSYNTRSRVTVEVSKRASGSDLSGTAVDALDIASKELGISKGDLLHEQQELMREFKSAYPTERNRDDSNSVLNTDADVDDPMGAHANFKFQLSPPRQHQQKLPGQKTRQPCTPAVDVGNVSQDFAEEFLTCSICEELFDERERLPKSLPCLHTFCKMCLEKLIDVKHEFHCPHCRENVQTPKKKVDGFPNNFLVLKQKSYFEEQQAAVGKVGAPTPQNQSEVTYNKCPQHTKQDLSLFCDTKQCQKPICFQCAYEDHQRSEGHHPVNMQNVVGKQRHMIEQEANRVQEIITLADSWLDEVKDQQEQLEENRSTQKQQVDTFFNNLIEKIEQRRNAMMSKIDIDTMNIQQSLQIEVQRYQSQLQSMRDSLVFAENTLHQGTDIQLLQRSGEILKKLSSVTDKQVKVPVGSTKRFPKFYSNKTTDKVIEGIPVTIGTHGYSNI